MKKLATFLFLIMFSSFSFSLDCKLGPAVKTIGGNEWLVYGCDDDKSIVIVSGKENPASPFVFFVIFNDGVYQKRGEGNGDKKATEAAFDEVKSYSNSEILSLLEEAKNT